MKAKSLQTRLTLTLGLTTLALAALAAALSAGISYQESQRFQDRILSRAAFAPPDGVAPEEPPEGRPDHIQVQRPRGPQIIALGNLPDGYHNIERGSEPYRIYIRTRPDRQRIAALQPRHLRDRNAARAAFFSAAPLLVLIPVLALLIALISKRTLAPVNRIARELDERGEYDNTPIPTGELPAEIQSYTRAINRLLARNAQTIENQQRFIADAAHELRTPMTALTLQAERLGQNRLPEPAHGQLLTLQQGIRRNRALLEQLLTLARSRNSTTDPQARADVQTVFRHVLETLLPLAQAKNSDLGIASTDTATLAIPATDLYILVKNLADNAIRYSPPGSQIDLRCESENGHIAIVVEDNGPGIEQTQRAAVIEAFHRILGSGEEGTGLGLAIVNVLAEKYRAEFRLEDAQHFDHGLRAEILFPRVA